MLFSKVSALLEDGIHPNLYIAVSGERIASVSETPPKGDFGEVIPGANRLLLPGFYNAHSHIPMVLMRGYGENMNLQDWLEKRIFPFEALLSERDIYWATLLGAAEMARFGVVSCTDMYFRLDAIARAIAEFGAKINLSNGATNFDASPYASLSSTREQYAALRDWHGAENGRILIDFSLHAEYTSDEATARAVAEDAMKHGCRVHAHASETSAEHEACKSRRNGRTPVRYLADCGLLDMPATLAHCVWIEPEDFDILKEKGATIANCARSNLKLGCGVFNAKAALEKRVPFAVGTDGMASNNNMNFIEEIRAMLLAQKGFSGDPTLVSPLQAYHAATRAGACSQGRADCGVIAEGMRADLVLLDCASPSMRPCHSMLNNLAYAASGSDVMMTLCDGRVLYREGEYPTIDLERAAYEVERSRARIVAALGGGA